MCIAPLFTTAKRQTQTTCPSTWTDKQNEVYTHNDVLFRFKKEGNPDTGYNMDETWRHYPKWNKSYTKGNKSYTNITWFYSYEVSRVVRFIDSK